MVNFSEQYGRHTAHFAAAIAGAANCQCGHNAADHGTPGQPDEGTGPCYWCGRPGNGSHPCPGFNSAPAWYQGTRA